MFKGKRVLSQLSTIVFIFTVIPSYLFSMELEKVEHEHKSELTINEKELPTITLAISKQKGQIMDLAERSKSAHDNTRLTRLLKKAKEGKIKNSEKGFVAYKVGTNKSDVATYIESTLKSPDQIHVSGEKIVVRKNFTNAFRHVSDKGIERDISVFEIEINLKSVEKELETTGIHKYIGDKAQLIHAYPTE